MPLCQHLHLWQWQYGKEETTTNLGRNWSPHLLAGLEAEHRLFCRDNAVSYRTCLWALKFVEHGRKPIFFNLVRNPRLKVTEFTMIAFLSHMHLGPIRSVCGSAYCLETHLSSRRRPSRAIARQFNLKPRCITGSPMSSRMPWVFGSERMLCNISID